MSQIPTLSTIAILFFVEGYSLREIANLYGLSELQAEDILRDSLVESESQKKQTRTYMFIPKDIPF